MLEESADSRGRPSAVASEVLRVSRALVLFTGDLRVHDNDALGAAPSPSMMQVVPAFVLDEALLEGSCGAANRVAFLLDCLRDLDDSLRSRGAGLVVRRGDPVEQAIRLANRWDVQSDPPRRGDDPLRPRSRGAPRRRLREGADRAAGIPGPRASSSPGALTPTGGDHYRVFTPYWRAWSAQDPAGRRAAPRRIRAPPRAARDEAPPLGVARAPAHPPPI